MDTPRKNPKILDSEWLIDSPYTRIQQQTLHFENGAVRKYRRTVGRGNGSVLSMAVTENREVLLIREYYAGTAQYEWSLPKGHIETSESPEEAAIRESQEETGFAAHNAQLIKAVSLSPGYMSHITYIFLLTNLYHAPLVGDEPEPIELFNLPIERIPELLQRADCTEARSLFALYYLLQHYNKQPSK